MKTLRLTPRLRAELKKPLGALIRLKPSESVVYLKNILDKEKPVKLVSVGDVVTETLIKENILPDIYIIDGRTLRGKYEARLKFSNMLTVKNEKGTISASVWDTISSAVKSEYKIGIFVVGEEDLLVLPCVIIAPLGSMIIYGQPKEGLVIIRVDEQTKRKINEIIDGMEEVTDETGS